SKRRPFGRRWSFHYFWERSGRAQRLTVALRGLDAGETLLDGLLHLLEGADLDLAHALAGDAELAGEILERDRVVAQAACLEDAALALVEHAERLAQRREAVAALFLGHEVRLLVVAVVDQPVLPFAVAVLAQGSVERSIAAEAAVHL